MGIRSLLRICISRKHSSKIVVDAFVPSSSISINHQDSSEVLEVSEVNIVLENIVTAIENTSVQEITLPGSCVEELNQLDLDKTNKKSKKLPAHMYNHKFWPSPRAVNFVRYMIKNLDLPLKYEGRLSHEKALNILAVYANITVDQLLQINPFEYSKNTLGHYHTISIAPLGLNKMDY